MAYSSGGTIYKVILLGENIYESSIAMRFSINEVVHDSSAVKKEFGTGLRAEAV